MPRVWPLGLRRQMHGKSRASTGNTMSITSELWTRESKQIEPNSAKLTRQLEFFLKSFVLLTRLKKLRKLLQRLLKQPRMSRQRRKSTPLITFFRWILLGHHSPSCSLKR
ncbi:uncharacterized protein LOC131329779 [Rhododendron vialii]|uniref:uncharacterized protein LOC131329779 n=1 Tax=Rhododendron vialii TaxID=182163 RepID=UPI00265D8D52|nr:uncharacterized protein LOC131329779 [Rhododendron vialii]